MSARLGKFLVVISLVLMTGLHWFALQTVAWTGMLASNLCQDSFAEAVSKTFDGEHPCCLCKAIAAAKKSQPKSEAAQLKLKLEFPLLAQRFVLVAPKAFAAYHNEALSASLLMVKPLLPPPRSWVA